MLEYKFRKNSILTLSDDVLETFDEYRQNDGQLESGGILLGRIFNNLNVIIDIATIPTGYDKASRYSFESSQLASQTIVNSIWNRTDGKCIYLGEWHTHPELFPAPSSRDRAMIKNMFRQSKIQTDFLFLIIYGIEDLWVGSMDEVGLQRLNLLKRSRRNPRATPVR
jgi:integrative and conjugative element protein (TIGR02256 family)